MTSTIYCEVCLEDESNLYMYRESIYCQTDLDRAMVEKWHDDSAQVKFVEVNR